MPVDLGWVDGDGGVQSPGTSTRQVSWGGGETELNGARLGWAVGGGRADARTQHRGKRLLEKVMGCVRVCVHVCARMCTRACCVPDSMSPHAVGSRKVSTP